MTVPRVLVVDDEPTIRHVLKLQLESAGFEVETEENGAAGLARAGTMMPDLILLDVMMPEMDGFDVCRAIRASQRTLHIPVIMLTAKTDSSDKVSGLEAGANDYLEKPFAYLELVARVRGVLAWSRAQRDASPLTGLPGNMSIEAVTLRRMASGQPYAFMYMDIDQFKAYNDRYGYGCGDDAIRLLADLLVATTENVGTREDFVGHIGGDDFVLVCDYEHGVAVSEELIRRFDAAVPALYSAEDRERGYVEYINRQGAQERARLMSVTVALVTSEDGEFTHYAQLIDVVAQLKSYGKKKQGSVVVRERRGDGNSAHEVVFSGPGRAAAA